MDMYNDDLKKELKKRVKKKELKKELTKNKYIITDKKGSSYHRREE